MQEQSQQYRPAHKNEGTGTLKVKEPLVIPGLPKYLFFIRVLDNGRERVYISVVCVLYIGGGQVKHQKQASRASHDSIVCEHFKMY